MKHGNLIIEKGEYVLLKRLVNLSAYYSDQTQQKSIFKLAGELEHAQVKDQEDMPRDVIRFNTWITIGANNGWHKKFKLVLPKNSDVATDKISVLAPMGAAVMGYAEGDTVIWDFPAGEQQLTILKVEQEENPINVDVIV
ncbi:GreA/GreB family elongation factor [Flagellimonas amoyensis]|uniref:GreA/GreB family elongation factor n=1 Tax=Flagellimonas amoyensis TaxID=2169401 RepID=UPI000D3566A8|nr:GreA/GreB family elongation factor [Allomuricauda amoyensis]